jgi:hypothetical protein
MVEVPMWAVSINWGIDTINRRKGKIDPKPPYQRGPVWNEAKKQLLIDTILRKYDIPKIYLRKLSEGSPYEHEVADGQQRLRAIWEFCEDKFAISDDAEPFDKYGDLKGKRYSELHSDAQDNIGLYQLTIAELHDASEIEIRDLFLRLQEGVSLNPAEKRNAMIGGMRDFIYEFAERPHIVLPLTKLSSNRYGWHDLLAHVTCLELAGGPTDLKAADLKKMYEREQKFKIDGPQAKRIEKILNYMSRVLKPEPPEMDIKWGFVDIYLAISTLEKEFVLKNREEDILNFYISFEKDRRATKDLTDLISDGDPWDRDLFDYIDAFVREGATKKNIGIRHAVYMKRIFRDLPDLAAKDPQRPFSRDQRVVIWRRDKEDCQSCKKEVRFEDMHADHIIPHSKGGVTAIDNGQTLCSLCNARKGAK